MGITIKHREHNGHCETRIPFITVVTVYGYYTSVLSTINSSYLHPTLKDHAADTRELASYNYTKELKQKRSSSTQVKKWFSKLFKQ